MATIRIREKPNSRAAGPDEARIVLQAWTSTRVGHLAIMQAPGFPREGSWYSEPGGLTDRTLTLVYPPRIEQVERLAWEITCQYKPAELHPKTGLTASPFSEPIQYEYNSQDIEIYRTLDKDGKPLINSAGTMYDPQPVPWSIGVWTITRNEPYFSATKPKQFRNKVNSGTFRGFPAKTVLCKDIRSRSAMAGHLMYAVVTYEFWVNDAGWSLVLPDWGPLYLLQDPFGWGIKIEVRPEDGQKIKTNGLVWLDGNGGLLSAADVKAGKIKTKTFEMLPTASFSSLGLG